MQKLTMRQVTRNFKRFASQETTKNEFCVDEVGLWVNKVFQAHLKSERGLQGNLLVPLLATMPLHIVQKAQATDFSFPMPNCAITSFFVSMS